MKTLKENLLRNVGVGKIKLIESWLKENTAIVGRYTVDKDFKIAGEIPLGIMITNHDITEIPDYIQFPECVSYFDASDCPKLKTLRNCPRITAGYFSCEGCYSLTSLEGAPKEVGGFFSCNECKSLKDLKGAPQKVSGMFLCQNCRKLSSLKGCPNVVGDDFSCAGCRSLKSLQYCPKKTGGSFICYACGINFDEKYVKQKCDVGGKILV